MSQEASSNGMGATFGVYGAILLIAVVQVVVAITMGPSLGRMLVLAAIQAYLAVMFFMHLRDEKPSLRLALIPGTLFVLVMMNMIWADSFRLMVMRPFAK
ncbi:MAG TPA: cytochrome C oxidase subunit IV family protein [Candidatus Dormibacteraeota bacterium]|nr:cytochrome C oxidase subunit IV family protein [Candidatus Dormibacteraeota bacterium]